MNFAHLVLGSPSVYHRGAGEVPATNQVICTDPKQSYPEYKNANRKPSYVKR